MAEEKLRIRLVFEDQRILSKCQKKQGLKRSWIVLNPKCHRTVSEFSDHLLRTFSLYEACPHGLSLSMEGFVLPSFESSSVLKDKDIVCVKKKKKPLLELVGEDSEENVHAAIQVEERARTRPGQMLLANEEFRKETGGYESESEEDEPEEMAEEFVPKNKTPKKRKASYQKENGGYESLSEEDEPEKIAEEFVTKKRTSKKSKALVANEEFQKETGGFKSESEEDQPKEISEEIIPKKTTSKKRKALSKSPSSKRKKCKLATTEEVEGENAAVASKNNVAKKRTPLERTNNDEQNDATAKSVTNSKRSSQHEESQEPNKLCDLSAETKTVQGPSRSARRKKAKRQWLREKAKLEKEELQQKLPIITPSQKPDITISYQVTEENHCQALENQQPDEESDGDGDEVVPVEVRPGHIRFKPLAGTDQASPESEPPTENLLWSVNMTKKKGQKWGSEKTGFSKRYEQDFDEDSYQEQTTEVETPANCQIDFEKLVAYTGSVKKGDVVAYRLIELTTSWTPEVSPFRVGKISYYDPDSKKVTLLPVEEYPIEKKTEEEDDSEMQSDTSLYKEDGSLEIELSALIDVRCIKTSSQDSTEVAKSEPTKPNQTATKLKQSTSNCQQTPVKENGKVNPWEELSEALSAKKAELSEANNGWNKKGSSNGGGKSWSYKALRGSAMGPVMNYLRSQNEI